MIDYDEEWSFSLLYSCSGSVAIRALSFAFPAALFALGFTLIEQYYPDWRELCWIDGVVGSQTWTAATATLVFVIGFRTNRALARFWEGTGLLHQMRGEWFDTVSNCVTFSIGAKKAKPREVMRFRHTLVRLMSLAHGNALEEISDNQFQLETIDIRGIDVGTLKHLKECAEVHEFNKVEVLLHLIQSLIMSAFQDGLLEVPAPILSRVFQTISRGFVNLLNTKKITDTMFPFPYAQLIAILLFMNTILTPFLLVSLLPGSKAGPVLLSFIQVFGLCSMNYISIELENPFGKDDNDLPLYSFQNEMNSCLLMLLHPGTDMISGVSADCVMDFYELKTTLAMYAPEEEEEETPQLRRFDTKILTGIRARSSTDSFTRDKRSNDNKDSDQDGDSSGSPERNGGQESNVPEILEVTGTWAVVPANGPPAAGKPDLLQAPELLGMRPHEGGDGDPGAPSDGGRPTLDVSPLGAEKIEELLARSMADFNKSLDKWTKAIDESVTEMNSTFSAIRALNIRPEDKNAAKIL
eukprot:TRINITY_DN2504_c0_g2_i1.p1 TRINITY_DN2504_c0_g2~~TRINITY_DN2504_c0_g2_i1.p1  ORF type:complete len:524 (-),score=92.83 TRINITY_DN2504_c0_g2_i1:104-1675(-)